MKKILIGSPVNEMYDYCIEDYVRSLRALTYPNFDILLIDNSKNKRFFDKLKSMKIPVIRGTHYDDPRDRMVEGRNFLRKKVIDEGYDFLLNLDQDVIPPKDIIERFLQHKKRVITGVYFNYKSFTPKELGSRIGSRHGDLFPTLWKFTNKKGVMRQMREEELTGKMIQIAACGSGCLFVHNSILRKIRFHYSKEHDEPKRNYYVFDDVYFCEDLARLRIPLLADTSMICKHLIKNKPWIWKDHFSNLREK